MPIKPYEDHSIRLFGYWPMKTWVLLFCTSFTLGFCLSYLISNPPSSAPVAVHLNVTSDNQGGLEVSLDGNEKKISADRRRSLNPPVAQPRRPTAYASSRGLPELHPAISPAPAREAAGPRGSSIPEASSPSPARGGGLAGLLLDAARHELDGRTDQRDIILASIIPIIIRNRINEPASEKSAPAERETAAVKKIESIPAAIESAEEVLPVETIAEPETPPPAALEPRAEPSARSGIAPAGFRLTDVTFIDKFRGLRDYDPGGGAFNRGEKIQFHAELKGLEEEPSYEGQNESYTRRFSADWKLVDAASKIIDSRVIEEQRNFVYSVEERNLILEGKRGFVLLEDYRLPNTLAPGNYRILLRGRDLIAKKEATAVLELRIKKTSSLSSGRPEKLDTSDLEILPPYEEPETSPGVERNSTADSP